ncbi:MAG: hypothetical protein C0518_09265 [Opitutus sp.]|nr:hypothetical protein [Opitutus sp.]
MNPLRPFLPTGRHPRRVLGGYFAGLRLRLDLRCEFQHYVGLYEAETFPSLRRLGRGCRSVIDLGAAKGELAIRFLRIPGVSQVLAVEPSVEELAQFRSNLSLNSLAQDPRLRIHPGFAGAGAGAEWRTLDALGADLPEPIFIKIDIDGPEAQVLATGPRLLARDCRLLIETHSPEAEHDCGNQLHRLGYTIKVIANAWWRRLLPEHRVVPHNRWLAAWREPLR